MRESNIIYLNQCSDKDELIWIRENIAECLISIENFLLSQDLIREKANIDLAIELSKEDKNSEMIKYIIYKRDLELIKATFSIAVCQNAISLDNLLETAYELPDNISDIKNAIEKLKSETLKNKAILQDLIVTTKIRLKTKNLKKKIQRLDIDLGTDKKANNNLLIFKPKKK